LSGFDVAAGTRPKNMPLEVGHIDFYFITVLNDIDPITNNSSKNYNAYKQI
jgi:hypothetical protein